MHRLAPESHAELGRILKSAREGRALSLEATAKRLYIRAHYIRALEEGALERLPGEAYAKGYLRRYARFLALSETDVLTAYEKIGALPPRRLFSIPDTFRKEERPARALAAAALILALAVAFRAAWRPADSPEPLPPVAVEKPLKPRACEGNAGSWPPCYYDALPLFSPLMREAIVGKGNADHA